MNRATIVRAEATEAGIQLRMWVDDPEGRHVAVCEVEIPAEHLATYARDVVRQQQRSAQYQLELDR